MGKREREQPGDGGKESEGESERGREAERGKREIDRGESRVCQVPMVTRHSASWVGFVLHPFVHPSRTPFPLASSWSGVEGGGRERLVGVYMGWL